MACNVCFEEYNKSSRKRVTCGACEWSACMACNERYILLHAEPRCMNCKIVWDTEFIVSKLSRNLLKQIQDKKESALLQQETKLLPQTQYYLQYDTHINEECVRELRNLQLQNQTPTRRIKPSWLLASDLHASKQRIRVLRSYISAWNNRHAMLDIHNVPPELLTTSPGTAVFACPADPCNGFVMESDYKCGVCFQYYCDRCHKAKSHPHVCDPSEVETTTLIMDTSRPCPKCAVRIHKTSGCDQMWCTQCNAAFSWETGRLVEAGTVVHNPHYFEWRASNKPLPPYERVIARGYELQLNSIDHWYMMTMCRLNAHIQSIETRRFTADAADATTRDRNLDLRLKWLKQEVSDSKMARVLYQRHKKKEINGYRMQVFEIFNAKSIDLFHLFLHTSAPVVEEFRTLVARTNQRFEHLCKIHKRNMPHIDVITVDDSGRCVFDIYKHNGFIPMKNYLKSAEEL